MSYSGVFKKHNYSLGFNHVSKKHGYKSAIAAFFVNAAIAKNAAIARIFCSESTMSSTLRNIASIMISEKI